MTLEQMSARQAVLTVIYNGKDISGPLAESLISLAYSDNAPGNLDDLQITLEDSEGLWQGDWSPREGDTVTAAIKTINWKGPNQFEKLDFGTFDVDSFGLSGPPDTVTIQSLSLPVAGAQARREKRTRAWEKVTLRSMAQDIAGRAKLKLLYELDVNPVYDRVDQTEETDLSFLVAQCTSEGAAVKIANGYLILFDEHVYEQKKTVAKIVKGEYNILSYTFNWATTDSSYIACQLTYRDAKGKKDIKVTYTPPNAPTAGPILKINESVGSEAEALRVARNRLREQNKKFGKGSLSLVGDVRLVSSVTVDVQGWGRFDGKYILESAKHSVGGDGYTTDIGIRKVLGW